MVALLGLVVLAGCSFVRLGYGQAPELLYWWLDGYVDFTPEQSPRVRESLHSLMAWHRSTQLPDYAELLSAAQADALRDATPEQVCRFGDQVRDRMARLREPAVAAAAPIVVSLTPRQLQHLRRRFDKANEEFREEYLQDTPEERRRESLKRAQARMEDVYGRFDAAQRELLVQGLAASPFDAVTWGAEREARQQDILQTLDTLAAGRADVPRAEAALRALAGRMLESPRPAYRQYERALNDFNCQFVARLHNAMAPRQREAAARKLKGWEDDARSLLGAETRAGLTAAPR